MNKFYSKIHIVFFFSLDVDPREAANDIDTTRYSPSQSSAILRRSLPNEIDTEFDTEDLMSASIQKKPSDADASDFETKRSTVSCNNKFIPCSSVRNATDEPDYAIDFSIGNETPISMERSDELEAVATEPAVVSSNNLKNKSVDTKRSSLPEPDLTNLGFSREKRESSKEEKNDAFLNEIETLIESEPGLSEAAEFEPSRDDDLMSADLHRQEAAAIISPGNKLFSDEHMSKLTASVSKPKIEEDHGANDNLMTKEEVEKAHPTKHSSIAKKKHNSPHKSSKKDTKKSSTQDDMMYQRATPISNHRRSELSARSSSPEIRHARNFKISKRSKIESTNGELKSIFSEMHQATHKLTRSDIRKLAKTAVMLAALKSKNKKLDANFLEKEKRHWITKGKHSKHHKKRSHKRHHKSKKGTMNAVDSHASAPSEGMSFNIKDPGSQPEIAVHYSNKDNTEEKHVSPVKEVSINVEQQTSEKKAGSEFTEDISKKQKNNTGVSDDAMVDLIAKTAADEEQKRFSIQQAANPTPSAAVETTASSTQVNPIAKNETPTLTSTTTSTTTTSTTAASSTEAAALSTTAKAFDSTTTLAAKLIADDATSKDFLAKIAAEDPNLQKKSLVSRPDDDIDKAISDFDTSDLAAMTENTDSEKKSILPSADLSDSMASLRAVLGKVNPKKVPSKFLPDLPSGLRMIAWKRLIEKKKSQLADYEAVYGGAEVAPDNEPDKPVTINIDLDTHKSVNTAQIQDDDISYTKTNDEDKVTFAKTSSLENLQSDRKDLDHTTDENASFITTPVAEEDGETARHVHYLKKHIQGARSLRKLIAKTLVGHCKSTGKRILSAFIAMDKALERAQAIATVIGGKFNVDPAKIDNLVTDKEDQVVETFLRDIFTKL